jgi:hypothetical protein
MDYQELSALLQEQSKKRDEKAKACNRLVKQFVNGLIDQFKWPAGQVAYFPLEGNPNMAEYPHPVSVGSGPLQAMHFADGFFHVGLFVQVLPPSANQPSLADLVQGIRYVKVRTPIQMRAEDAHIVFKVGNQERKINPANAAAELLPMQETFLKNLKEYLGQFAEGRKPTTFGFCVDK